MADYFRLPGHSQRGGRGIQDPIRQQAAISTPSQVRSSSTGGGNGSNRQRIVRFDQEKGSRASDDPRIHKSPVLHSEEDRRPKTGSKSSSLKSVYHTSVIQNGDNRGSMSYNKQERLLNIVGSERCFSPCTNSPRLSQVPAVPMERPTVPVQGATLRPVTSPPGIHQSIASPTTVGSGAGNQDIGLHRRPHHCCGLQGAVDQGHCSCTGETSGARLLGQAQQISSDANTASGPPGIHNRHPDHVTGGPREQDQRHQEGGQQNDSQGRHDITPTIIIHRKSNSHVSSNIPCSSADEKFVAIEKRLSVIGSTLERLSLHLQGSNGGPNLVANQPPIVERMLLDSTTNRYG
ncbi:hypothetical protein BGX26_006722, partial [Mortierella sp. AD094]